VLHPVTPVQVDPTGHPCPIDFRQIFRHVLAKQPWPPAQGFEAEQESPEVPLPTSTQTVCSLLNTMHSSGAEQPVLVTGLQVEEPEHEPLEQVPEQH